MQEGLNATILITGGAGYIGSHTTQVLLNEGYKCVVIDNLSSGYIEALPPGAILAKGDLRDEKFVSEVFAKHQPKAVVHFAAKHVLPQSLVEPLFFYENNLMGLLHLLKSCQRYDVRHFVFSSTAAIYGEISGAELVHEDRPKNPLNPYGQSKLMCEQILKDTQRVMPLNFAILRYFNVAGAAVDLTNGQRLERGTNLIKVLAEVAVGARSVFEIYGDDYPTPDGTCIRDYIHVQDLADVHALALKALFEKKDSFTVNCGYGRGSSVAEVLASFEKILGHSLPKKILARRAGDAPQVVADVRRLRDLLGWKPLRDDLELICRTSLDWERKKLNA